MAVNQTNVQYGYGIGDALIKLAPLPIIAQRDPTTSDFAQLGTQWINEATATAWILASITSNVANWTTSPSSGGGNFTSVTVNPGDVDVTAGNINIDSGDLNLTLGTGRFGGGVVVDSGLEVNSGDITVSTVDPISLITTSTIDIGDANSDVVTIASATGLFVNTAGISSFDVLTDTQASPTATTTIDANLGACTFTGFTTAAGASQTFVINNNLATTASPILCNINNEGVNDAKMTVTRVNRFAGSFEVTATNNGTQALNGNVTVVFWLL